MCSHCWLCDVSTYDISFDRNRGEGSGFGYSGTIVSNLNLRRPELLVWPHPKGDVAVGIVSGIIQSCAALSTVAFSPLLMMGLERYRQSQEHWVAFTSFPRAIRCEWGCSYIAFCQEEILQMLGPDLPVWQEDEVGCLSENDFNSRVLVFRPQGHAEDRKESHLRRV